MSTKFKRAPVLITLPDSGEQRWIDGIVGATHTYSDGTTRDSVVTRDAMGRPVDIADV